tara:strand:- start:476 stop:697 length:222 start_codon:yes stop_codon:yes gene_type:complete
MIFKKIKSYWASNNINDAIDEARKDDIYCYQVLVRLSENQHDKLVLLCANKEVSKSFVVRTILDIAFDTIEKE